MIGAMGLTSENLKSCSVKISATISGVPSVGSGIIYQTPSFCNYNYILTAKHILSEDSATMFCISKLKYIKVEYYTEKRFETLFCLKEKEIKIDESLILFESEDLIILKMDKIIGLNFPSILVTDHLENDELRFSSWSIFKANEDTLHPFKFERSDPSHRRIELKSNVTKDYLEGFSGSGVFVHNKNILYGIISKYLNDGFENCTIECSDISFEKINIKLSNLNLVTLDDKSSFLKRELEGSIVELYQAPINNVYLDLNLALKRVKSDMVDDWFYDSLQYVDLLTPEYLFTQFQDYFYKNTYNASKAENFHVPKSNFTLREAYILPLIDRIIYMSVVGELAEVIDNSLIPNIFASRYNRVDKNTLLINGVEQWKKLKYKVSEELDKSEDGNFKYHCVLHVDILNYYDNIDKRLLIEKLKRIAVNDNQLNSIEILNNFLSNFSEKSNGIPQNTDSSALLATFYLNQVDTFMQNHTIAYYRFVDDIKILCADKYEARKYLTILEKELKRCHLSVNSQKTKIIEIIEEQGKDDDSVRENYHNIFNLELEQIKIFSKSYNYQNRNQAFHLAIDLLNKNINTDRNENDEEARNLKFSLSIIETLGKSKIHFLTQTQLFYSTIKKTVKTLKDKPWITHQLCKILSLIESEDFNKNFLEDLKLFVLDEKYNIYPYQQFQVWLLLAKKKVVCKKLIQYASLKVEINDKTNIPTTASQILYLSAVDKNYKRILLRKINENFTDGYFQNRATLIALRSFTLVEPKKESIHKTLKDSFRFTNKFGHKELVFYHDLELSESESNLIEQLFSI